MGRPPVLRPQLRRDPLDGAPARARTGDQAPSCVDPLG
jgi:hypothetical protein